MLLICLFWCASSSAQDLNSYREKIAAGTIEEKREALYQLRNLESEDASRAALPALKDPAEIVRATATHSALALPPGEAASNLLPMLKDKSPFVRKEAAYALGKTRHISAADGLILLLQKDKSDEVRGAAAYSLGLIGEKKAMPALLAALKRKNLFIQRSAVRSLGQIGDPSAIGQLELTLADPKNHEDIKREARAALEKLRK